MRAIFANPTSLLHHPESLDLLVKRIDELDWYNARKKGFGDLYEDLLQKHAYETRGGAGQYFTPRPLIECMVNVIRPKTGEYIEGQPEGSQSTHLMTSDIIDNPTGVYHVRATYIDSDGVIGTNPQTISNVIASSATASGLSDNA